MRRSGLAPVAAQLVVPVAMGLLIGGVVAYQAGSTNDAVQPVPLGAVPSPTPSFGKPPAPTASVTTTTTQAATTAANGNCGIIVPAHPLSAWRPPAPHQLTGGMTPADSGCT